MRTVVNFLKNESGATAIEYGRIAVAIITVVQGLGTKLQQAFKKISDGIK